MNPLLKHRAQFPPNLHNKIIAFLFINLLVLNRSEVFSQEQQISSVRPDHPEIRVEYFEPAPIEIHLQELPIPSKSTAKSPKIISIPSEASLKAPSGFRINVFAENLDQPRWLALTPSGDVLVTETYENRICLLKDADHDGVAD